MSFIYSKINVRDETIILLYKKTIILDFRRCESTKKIIKIKNIFNSKLITNVIIRIKTYISDLRIDSIQRTAQG